MRRLIVVGAALVAIAGCGGSGEETIVVSAASSLTDVLGEIESAYEQSHPGTDVVLNLGGSSLLREQILAGAPVDVFASASGPIMDSLADAGLIRGTPDVFAFNTIVIAVPPGNPGGVERLHDFAREDLFLGLCSPEVPCGALARDSLARAGVEPKPDTNEPNVRSLLTKIEAGELDAGVVYVTDVISARVAGVPIPENLASRAAYPVALINEAPNPDGGADFVAFLLSQRGTEILRAHGFESP